MDVYYNGNGNTWDSGHRDQKLAGFPIRQSFLWETQEFFIPAVYVGKSGAVLDVCAKIPSEDMIQFLRKWNKEKRLALRSQEEFDQIDADNPGSREFRTEMCLNKIPLTLRMSSSLRWYPENVFHAGNETIPASLDQASSLQDEAWQNDNDAEKLMNAYGCDHSCCWHFARFIYQWNGEPILFPQEISLRLQSCPLSVTTEHFTTDLSCHDQELKTIHPKTGQEFTLTLHGCEQIRNDFSEIGQKDMHYPEYCHTLSYSIQPESGRDFIHIRDQVQSDPPRKITDPIDTIGGQSGPTAIFMAGKNPTPGRQMACSSLHYDLVPEVNWRVVFDIIPRENIEVRFAISKPESV